MNPVVAPFLKDRSCLQKKTMHLKYAFMQNLNICIQEKLLKLQKNKDETKWVNKDSRLNASEEKEGALTYSQICSQ